MKQNSAHLKQLRIWEKDLIGAKNDAKDPLVLLNIRQLANQILSLGLSSSSLADLEKLASSAGIKETFSNFTHLAIKLAKSKTILAGKNVHVSVIMPAYGENIRMMPRGTNEGQHPSGENFIIEKSKQLEWLFEGSDSTYQVYIVDDMSKPDPITSGEAAKHIIEDEGVNHFKVIFLKDGVTQKSSNPSLAKVLNGVEYPKNTRKAGAIYYGSFCAIEEFGIKSNHIIIITDCDLSVDLGQIGNLSEPIIVSGKTAGAGSRRLPESILEIAGSRNLRANTARYFRQLLLPGLLPKDTQCGAKAFTAKSLQRIFETDRLVLDFAFDIELLTLIALQNGPDSIVPIPVAWFDSAELTTTDSSVHLRIMKAQLDIAKANHTGSGKIFEQLIHISEILTQDEKIWMAFLDQLEQRSDLTQAMENFNTDILPDLERIANTVSV